MSAPFPLHEAGARRLVAPAMPGTVAECDARLRRLSRSRTRSTAHPVHFRLAERIDELLEHRQNLTAGGTQ